MEIGSVYCIGYAGRDQKKVQEHIDELAELGVPRPSETPTLYPVSVSTLNQKGAIEVIGKESSGEAEIVLLFGETEDELYITTGSDHTDRALETVSINISKQVCDKPVANKAWSYSKVKRSLGSAYAKVSGMDQWKMGKLSRTSIDSHLTC